jgi:hypothetical protein
MIVCFYALHARFVNRVCLVCLGEHVVAQGIDSEEGLFAQGFVVQIAVGSQGVITSPPIRLDLRTCLGNSSNKGNEALFGYIRDSLYTNSTKSFR